MKHISEIPLNTVAPVSSIREMLSRAGREAADTCAFRYLSGDTVKDVSYRDFIRDVYALGAALHERGLSAAHIALIGENSYPWVTVYLAMLAGAGVFVPIDRELPPKDIAHLLRHSDSETVFYSAAYAATVEQLAPELTHTRFFIQIPQAGKKEPPLPRDARFLSYTALLHRGHELTERGYTGYATLQPDRTELRMIAYTSGTTGLAKGVMLSEQNLCASVYNGLRAAQVYSVYLSILPYHHLYEAVCGLLVAIHHHSTVCINDDTSHTMKNFARFQPEYAYVVPAYAEEFYRRIWTNAQKTGREKNFATLIQTSNALRKAGIDMRASFFSSIREAFGGRLKKLVCGGAPMRPELGQFFEDIGVPLYNGYGATECAPLISVNRDGYNDPATVGAPLPCYELRLTDVGEDGEGEICLRGDTVMMGYYNDPVRTAEALREGGWFFTGDYGKLRADGLLCITGRKKNIIVLSNGKKIYPEELEGYMRSIPYVREAIIYSPLNELGNATSLHAEVALDAQKLAEMGITQPAAALRRDVTRTFAALPLYKQISKIIIQEKS